MKKVLLFVSIVALVLTACGKREQKSNGKFSPSDIQNPNSLSEVDDTLFPVITYQDTVFNFGTIEEGASVTHDFNFTNTGKANLVIVSSQTSCGCTVTDLPQDPIPPGGTGIIKLTFNSAGKRGEMNKIVNIIANTNPNVSVLRIKGIVETKQNNN